MIGVPPVLTICRAPDSPGPGMLEMSTLCTWPADRWGTVTDGVNVDLPIHFSVTSASWSVAISISCSFTVVPDGAAGMPGRAIAPGGLAGSISWPGGLAWLPDWTTRPWFTVWAEFDIRPFESYSATLTWAVRESVSAMLSWAIGFASVPAPMNQKSVSGWTQAAAARP